MRSAAVLSILSLVTGGHAWAQAASGEWIANMKIYDVTNGGWPKATDEACTYRNTRERVPIGGACKFWLDGNGRIAYGRSPELYTRASRGLTSSILPQVGDPPSQR
ncbi:hypothetical protein HJFPF1_09606 [Paramyrothecium foliicola]|nr:hypothetical protein HJFPF1_09606 [Paramyrothecium foliicola]